MAEARAAHTSSDGFSIVVPTFNEVGNLERFFGRIERALHGTVEPWELLVVDDDSPDGTADHADSFVSSFGFRLRVLRRRGRRSLSLSVVDGAKHARHRTCVVLDADLSHDPKHIPALLRMTRDPACDVAIASRYTEGGGIAKWSVRRHALSRTGTSLARVLTRVSDPLSGYFACRRELLAGEDVQIRPRGYKILLELLARAPRLRVTEVPIEFHDRDRGRSKLGLRQKLEFLIQLVSLCRFRIRTGIRTAFASPFTTQRPEKEGFHES